MKFNRIAATRFLVGMSSIGLAGYAAPALADNECGVAANGVVRCTSTGNPAAAGVTYVLPTDISVTTNSDVVARGTINVTSVGGAASVVSSGQVATTAANTPGIVATGLGNVGVTAASVTTTGANSGGVIATSTAGAVTVSTGTVSVGANGGAAILALGQNAVTITSGAASALNNSAVFARSQAGAVNLTVTGANTSTTADSAVSLTSGSTITVNVGSGGSVSGQNAITLAPQTTSTVTNAGTLTGTAGYAVFANRGTTTITNSGTLNSGVSLAGAGNVVTNTGTFNATRSSIFGTSATLTNTGLVQVTSAAPTTGVTFFGLSSVTNSGTVSLANGRSGDVLTVPGTFAGSGSSTLILDTTPGGTVDRLVIGGAATGTTNVQLVNVTGGAGLLNSGSVIVSTGAGTAATAFQLDAGSTGAGFVRNAIAFNGTTNTFSLVSTPATSAYRSLRYSEAARNIWYKVSDVWQAHLRSLRDSSGGEGRLWGQFYGTTSKRRDGIVTTTFGQTVAHDLSYSQDTFGGQLGFDLSPPTESGGVTFGVTGGYTSSDLQFLGRRSHGRFDVVNAGGYAGFNVGGVFVNVLGQYAHYWLRASDIGIGLDQRIRGNSYGATGEAGFRFGDAGFYVEPLVTLSYVRTDLNDFTALSSTFDFRGTNGLRGKAGARLGTSTDWGSSKVTLYAGGNAVKAFRGRDNVVFTNNGTSLVFRDERIGLYGEGFGGVSILSSGGVSGFFEGFGEFGRVNTQRGGGARAGLRLAF